MGMADSVTRRATIRPNNDSLDDAEAGKGHGIPKVSRLPGSNRRRRRKTRTDKRISLHLRRLSLAIRRNPRRARKLAIAFGGAIFICLLLDLALHQNVDEPPNHWTERIKKPLKKRILNRIPKLKERDMKPIDLLLQTIPDRPSLFAMPEKMAPVDRDEGYYYDHGGLQLTFLEFDDEQRNILKDVRLKKTIFRHPDADLDDDIDAYVVEFFFAFFLFIAH